ncbi:MAG: HAMP domain-containing histidine kinase [Muribaculaceae bacterium]|nr:HAMP domain-containing histidine kinase [Muribaculaceae bacterium]
MKRLRLISYLAIAMIVFATIIGIINLVRLYNHEKKVMTQTIKECVENALVLEMVGRMEKSSAAEQSFIRLNDFIEFSQQRNGRIAQTDSVRTSLISIMRFGLEFPDDDSKENRTMLDSLFKRELSRHDLHPSFAAIESVGSPKPAVSDVWTINYMIRPSKTPDYVVYVASLSGKVLSRMWGIILPFVSVILIMSFLIAYLLKTIGRIRTIEQMKDDFTHNMTHELKTPVAVAYSAADSMLRYYDQSDEARNRQFLKIIMQRLSFLAGMIENILSMSMERFKTMKLKIEQVALKPIVEEIAAMMELKADKGIKMEIDVPDNLSVMADSLHLGNVLSNLMDNAVKYSGDSVEINIKANSSSIEISDNGIGIDKSDLPYIFDKFYRVSSGDRYEVGGYGLGLFYVKQIVELLGWSIEVTSKPRQGTKFIIRFKSHEER